MRQTHAPGVPGPVAVGSTTVPSRRTRNRPVDGSRNVAASSLSPEPSSSTAFGSSEGSRTAVTRHWSNEPATGVTLTRAPRP